MMAVYEDAQSREQAMFMFVQWLAHLEVDHSADCVVLGRAKRDARELLRDMGGSLEPAAGGLSREDEIESLRAQVEYERASRIAAANFPRNRHGYVPCGRCGIDCGMDVVVPDEVWARISPVPEVPEGGMLCLWCMDEQLLQAGEHDVVARVYFIGKVLRSAPSAKEWE